MNNIERLLNLVRKLRDPETGCPWDLAQNYASIVPHTLEEAYEVADAIQREDKAALKDELGDLLFQVVFYAQLAREEGAFSFADVVAAVTEKMIRRHPHVFGDAQYATVSEQTAAWENIKALEQGDVRSGVLDGIPLALPALTRALKLQRKAARVGFDWSEAASVLAKVREELEEIEEVIAHSADRDQLQEEIGDLLFACTNLARHRQVDPEAALRAANAKFERRFRGIEARLAETERTPQQASLNEMDELWEQVKRQEKVK
jgi:MazG family protein